MKEISVETFYLEMRQPKHFFLMKPHSDLLIYKAENIPVNYYRFLYQEIGGQWGWSRRTTINDIELKSIINSSKTEIYILYFKGVPAGFIEWDTSVVNEIEIVYFGLMPHCIGQGFGKYFFQWALQKIWGYYPRRIWLHTCEFDHPSAMKIYQETGFEIIEKKTEIELYPDKFMKK